MPVSRDVDQAISLTTRQKQSLKKDKRVSPIPSTSKNLNGPIKEHDERTEILRTRNVAKERVKVITGLPIATVGVVIGNMEMELGVRGKYDSSLFSLLDDLK